MPDVMVRLDLHALGFRNNSFDLIICIHVLEHLADDLQCLRELYRVLKSGGLAILDSPVDESLSHTIEWGAPGMADHWREYGRDFYDRLVEASFTIIPGGKNIAAVKK